MTALRTAKGSTRGRLPGWFSVLLMLDAFSWGGFVALELVRQLLETIGRRSLPQGQGDILNVLDHLVPYYLGFAAAVLAVGLATIGAYALIVLAARMGRRNVLSEAPRR